MFHVIVLTVAIVTLILVLTVVGLLMANKSKSSLVYPPEYNTCPDYWTIVPVPDGSGQTQCIIPTNQSSLNIGSLYNSSGNLTASVLNTPGYTSDVSNNYTTNYLNFNAAGWKGVCSMKTWANNNGIVWDGVANYNSC